MALALGPNTTDEGRLKTLRRAWRKGHRKEQPLFILRSEDSVHRASSVAASTFTQADPDKQCQAPTHATLVR